MFKTFNLSFKNFVFRHNNTLYYVVIIYHPTEYSVIMITSINTDWQADRRTDYRHPVGHMT